MSIKFFRRIFLSHGAETFHFVGQPFNVSQTSGIENKLCFRGLRQNFCRYICCLTQLKNFLGESFSAVFRKFPGSEKVYG